MIRTHISRAFLFGLNLIFVACSQVSTAATIPRATISSTSTTVEIQTTSISTPTPRRLWPGELVLAADIDDIPAIFASDEMFVDAAEDRELHPQEPIIGVSLNGIAHAYPVRLLSLHEIVNDEVGGIPIAVTWCPLCYTAITFDRRLDGGVLTFGVSGYLYYNNLVMYDHQSNTLWSQALGQALRGARRGQQLSLQPSILTTWEAWVETYPDTLVLSIQAVEDDPERALDPYVGYYTSGAAGIIGRSVEDDRLGIKQLVVGLAIGREARAYPLDRVQDERLINDRLGQEAIVLVYDPGIGHVFIYRRLIDSMELAFELLSDGETMIDLATSSRWDIRTGAAVDGPHQGRSLERIIAPAIFWFAWVDLYPDTQVYE